MESEKATQCRYLSPVHLDSHLTWNCGSTSELVYAEERSKDVHVHCHFFHMVSQDETDLAYYKSKYQVVHLFTKSLKLYAFNKLKDMIKLGIFELRVTMMMVIQIYPYSLGCVYHCFDRILSLAIMDNIGLGSI